MSKEKELRIRNSTAEFLIFTRQAGEDGIEVQVADVVDGKAVCRDFRHTAEERT